MQIESAKRGVLVVDEDTAFARRLVEFLHRQGFAASAVSSHEDALAAASAERPDLALVALPLESALTLGDSLRARCNVQFMVLGSADDAETARRATDAGALAYLVKAAQVQHYMTTVHAAVSRAGELRILRRREAQLTRALQQTRIINKATGALMEQLRLNRDDAFDRLRNLARVQRRRLSEVAEELLRSMDTLDSDALVPSPDKPA